MADKTTDQPHMEETKIIDAPNNLTNNVTSDETTLINLISLNFKLSGQLKVLLPQNKVLTELPRKKICGL